MHARRAILAALAAFLIAVPGRAGTELWRHGEALRAFEGLELREIRVEGNHRTRLVTVLRELTLHPGEPFRGERLRADLRFLEGLGLFLSAEARARPEGKGLLLVLELEERSRPSNELIYPTLEFDEDLRFKAGLTFRNRNLRGLREDLTISRTLGYEDSIFLRLRRPWLGTYPLEHSFSYSLRELDADDVTEYRDEGLSLSLLLPLDRRRPRRHRFVLGGGFGWRRQLEDAELWDERLHHLLLGYSHDGRDSFFRPRRGSRLDALLVLHHPRLDSSHSLRRWVISASHYRKLDGIGVLAGRLELGLQQGTLFHRGTWSLGGMGTVRGWGPGEFSGWEAVDGTLGPQGRNRLMAQLEWRRTLFPQQRWQLTPWWTLDFEGEVLLFLDGGLLWANAAPWEAGAAGDRALGFGGGIRIYSPLGDVLRLELGLNAAGGLRLHAGNAYPF